TCGLPAAARASPEPVPPSAGLELAVRRVHHARPALQPASAARGTRARAAAGPDSAAPAGAPPAMAAAVLRALEPCVRHDHDDRDRHRRRALAVDPPAWPVPAELRARLPARLREPAP